MARSIRTAGGAIAAVLIATLGVGTYAALCVPLYRVCAHVLSAGRPWKQIVIDVAREGGAARIVRLTGVVTADGRDPRRRAEVVASLQAGALAQTPLVLWSVVLLWPLASGRARGRALLATVPVWILLDLLAAVVPLLSPMAEASAALAGDTAVTAWERWTRFEESGGRIALALSCALLIVALAGRTERGPRNLATPGGAPYR